MAVDINLSFVFFKRILSFTLKPSSLAGLNSTSLRESINRRIPASFNQSAPASKRSSSSD